MFVMPYRRKIYLRVRRVALRHAGPIERLIGAYTARFRNALHKHAPLFAVFLVSRRLAYIHPLIHSVACRGRIGPYGEMKLNGDI